MFIFLPRAHLPHTLTAKDAIPAPNSSAVAYSRTNYLATGIPRTRNIAMSTLNSVRGPTPADANPSTRGLRWIRAHTA